MLLLQRFTTGSSPKLLAKIQNCHCLFFPGFPPILTTATTATTTTTAKMGSSASSNNNNKDVNVVVVGGGFGGACCAMRLKQNGINFKLIDSKSFFHHNIAALRAAVEPAFLDRTAIPYDASFGNSFVQGRVTGVDLKERKLTLDTTEEKMSYTHLVLATGSVGSFPCKSNARTRAELDEQYKGIAVEIEKASSVVLIGGGPVGVEMAGEILDKYSQKRLTLLHSGPALLSRSNMGGKVQARVLEALEGKGVAVMLGETVTNLKDLTFAKFQKQTVKTDKGLAIEADLVLFCTGLTPATDLLPKVFDASKFDKEKRLRVDPLLQVEGLSKVFAVGDCGNVAEEKMAAHATNQGILVADNIIRMVKGGKPKDYHSQFTGMFVTVGEKGGSGVVNGWTLPTFMVSMIKGKDLLTKMYWGKLGQKVPN